MEQQNKAEGTVKSSTYVRDDYTPSGVYKVYNYQLNEYRGLVQARHNGNAIADGTEVIFEFKFTDKKNHIAVGSLMKKSSYNSIQSRKDDENITLEEFPNDSWQPRAAALNAAVNTPGVKDEEEAVVLATRYLEWILDVDLTDDLDSI